MADAVILAARRTAFATAGGLFRTRSAARLVGPVLGALLDDCALNPAEVDRLILGSTLDGCHLARDATLDAGLPADCPAVTLDMQEASGLEAILQAICCVRAGLARVVIAGGVDSPSTAPVCLLPSGDPAVPPRLRPPFVLTGPDLEGREHLLDIARVDTAEALAETCGITAERQRTHAQRSLDTLAQALEADRFTYELTAVTDPAGEPDTTLRLARSPDEIARAAPLLPQGTITLDGVSPAADGAALVMVMEADMARALGATGALRLVDAAASGVSPDLPGLGAVPAVRRLASRRSDFDLAALDQIEMAETLAAETLACLDRLAIRETAICPGGSSLGLGHPTGAVGALLVVRLFHDLMTGPGRRGLALVSTRSGLGAAALFETVAL